MVKIKKPNFWTIIFGIGFVISALINIFLYNKKQTPLIPQYSVLAVLDGDTFLMEGKNKIRLRQIQAPELNLCGGPEAKTALEKLIIGKKVRLENQIPDPWGRSMAIVFVGDENVNEKLIASGLVRYYHDNTPFEDQLKKAALDAENKQKGIYAKCETATPPNPKCVIKANIRLERKTRKYYLPDCPQYNFTKISQDLGEKWFCSEKEAKAAGFTKAENCK